MLKNLKIEWMKIKDYRVFRVFSLLYLVGIVVMIYIIYKIYIDLIGSIQSGISGGNSEGSDFFKLFTGENIFYATGFFTSFLLYLPGMVIINLFINEVNFKTHRQNIIDGWKRETFIYSKIGLIACFSLAIMLMNLLAVVILSQIINVTPDYVIGAKVLVYIFLQAFIYLMFALMLATLLRKSGIAIIVFFIYGLIFEFLLMWLVGYINPSLRFMLPLSVADSLTPVTRSFGDFYKNRPGEVVMFIAALAYASVYIYFAVRKYQKDDL